VFGTSERMQRWQLEMNRREQRQQSRRAPLAPCSPSALLPPSARDLPCMLLRSLNFAEFPLGLMINFVERNLTDGRPGGTVPARGNRVDRGNGDNTLRFLGFLLFKIPRSHFTKCRSYSGAVPYG
jgi:hypothetical protein